MPKTQYQNDLERAIERFALVITSFDNAPGVNQDCLQKAKEHFEVGTLYLERAVSGE
jgi:hypothetical protein